MRVASVIASALLLSATASIIVACGGKDAAPLEGERENVIQSLVELKPDSRLESFKIKFPKPEDEKAIWAQAGGSASNAGRHMFLPERVTKAWSKNVMSSVNREQGLTNAPIVADGKVYLMTPKNKVIALDAWSGEKLWERQLISKKERSGAGVAGGISNEKGILFATTSNGFVVALDGVAGDELWRQNVKAPVRAAPTVKNDRVFVVSHDNRLHVFSADSGELLWTHSGIEESIAILGGASPAVAEGVVVVPYSSGEIYALSSVDGRYLWQETLAGRANYDPLANLTDIVAPPVITDGNVYVANASGQMAVLNLKTGRRVWKRDFSAQSVPVVIGNAIFMVTNSNHMVGLERATGRIKWVLDLGRNSMTDKDERVFWYGPVLAGDRLMAIASDGHAISVSPEEGTKLGLVDMKVRASVPPVVAGGLLYFLTDTGRVVAYD